MGSITNGIIVHSNNRNREHPLDAHPMSENELILMIGDYTDHFTRTPKNVGSRLAGISRTARANFENMLQRMKAIETEAKNQAPMEAAGRPVRRMTRAEIETTDFSDEAAAKRELIVFQTGDDKAIRRLKFDRFKKAMVKLAENRNVFQADITVEELAAVYPQYFGVLSIATYDVGALDDLVNEMQSKSELSEEEKAMVPQIRDAFNEIKYIHGLLDQKFSILLNPIFPLVGEDIFNLDKAEELTRNLGIENREFGENFLVDLQEDLFHWFMERQNMQHEQWKKEFGENMQLLSPETGGVDSLSAVSKKPSADFERVLSRKIYVRSENGTGNWFLMERQNNGVLVRKEVPAVEQEKLSAEYRERKANQEELSRITGELPHNITAPNGTSLPWTNPAADGLWVQLKEHGALYARDEERQRMTRVTLEGGRVTSSTVSLDGVSMINAVAIKKPTVFFTTGLERITTDMTTTGAIWDYLKNPEHHAFYYQDPGTKEMYSVGLAGEEVVRNAVSAEQWKALSEQWAEQYVAGREDVGPNTRARLAAEHSVPGSTINEIYHKLYELRTMLKNNTKGILRSSDAYRSVEYALDRVLKNMPNMSRTDLSAQLLSIDFFAEKYCSGKTERDLENNYTAARYEGMRSIQATVRDYMADIERMDALRMPIGTPAKTMDSDDREELSKNLRRAMRNNPFNKRLFSAWKALEDFDEAKNATVEQRRAETEKIENSKALRLMEEHLQQRTISDEKVLNRFYETEKAVEAKLAQIKKLNKFKFFETYKHAMKLSPSNMRSGDAAFDQAVFEHFKVEMRRIARIKGMDVREDFEIRNTGEVLQNNFFTRRKLAAAYKEAFKGSAIEIREGQQGNLEVETKDAICQEVFGTNHTEVNEMINAVASGFRNRAWMMTLGMLIYNGLTPEEIFTPGVKTDTKRAVGQFMQNQIREAKTPEQKKAVADSYFRAVMDATPKLYEHVHAYHERVRMDDPETLKEFIRKTSGISEGIYDQVFQVQLKLEDVRWKNQETAKEYSRIYRKENESFEEMKARLDYLEHVSKGQMKHLLAELKLGNLIAKNANDLADPALVDATLDLEKEIADIYDARYFSFNPGYLSREEKERNINADFYNQASNYFARAFYKNVLGDIDDFGKLLLAQSLSNRIRVELNAEAYRQPQDPVKLARLMGIKEPGFVKTFLKTANGVEREISWKLFSTGVPENEEERAFMDQFREEVMVISEQKEAETEAAFYQESAAKVNAVPDTYAVYKELLQAFPKATADILPFVERYSEYTPAHVEGIDPFECVMIGKVSGSALLKRELERLGTSYDQATVSQKNVIMTALSVAAIANGNPVTIVGNNPNFKEYGFCKSFNKNSLEVPVLSGEAAAEKKTALANVWNPIRTSVTVPEGTDIKKLHNELIASQEKKMCTITDRMMMARDEQTKNHFAAITFDKASELQKKMDDFREALTAKAAHKGIYSFANGMRMNASTAILLIAFAGINNGVSTLRLPAGARLEAPLNEEQQKVIDAATAAFNQIAELRTAEPAAADRTLRAYILNGINKMNLKEVQPTGDLETYANKYAGQISVMIEAIGFMAKDTAEAGLGTQAADQKKTLKALSEGRAITNDRDLAAMAFVEMAQGLKKAYDCIDVRKNMKAVEQSFGKYLYLSKQLGNETKNSTLQQLRESSKKAEGFSNKLIDEKSFPEFDPKESYSTDLPRALLKMNQAMNTKDATYESVQHAIEQEAARQQVAPQQAVPAQQAPQNGAPAQPAPNVRK